MMERITNKVLDNGLRVIIVENKDKHTNKASIIINSGGNAIKYKKNNKEYELKKGIAHYLEHYLIEKSYDGNMGEYFSNESIGFNGITNSDKTEFYISTVHDFIYNFKKLLKMVNRPYFKEEAVNEIKKPIIEEIKRSEDNKYRNETKKKMNAFYTNLLGDINLGSIEDVESMNISDLKEYYDCFYRPSNEIVSVYTNIDTDRILKIIEKEYNRYKNKDNVKEIIPKESLEVKENKLTIIDKDEDEYLELLFKIDVKDFEPVEKIKLDAYLEYFLKSNFGEESPLFKELIDNKLSLYSINKHFSFLRDQDIMYLFLQVYVLDNKFDVVREKLIDTINNIKYNKDDFIVWKNNNIISYIDSDEKIYFKNYLLIDSLIYYGCEYLETVDDLKKYNLEEAISLFKKLKFDKYVEVRRIKGE